MPATRLRIFLGSVQKEFATLRHNLKAFLLRDAFLRRFIAEVFLFAVYLMVLPQGAVE